MTDITLLDGGMGQQLVRLSDRATPLWATQFLLDQPALVARVHADFAEAGATVASTNTYALHRDRLRGGASNHYAQDGAELPDLEAQFLPLHAAAVKAVETVRDRCRIAGSIGPLGASYRADLLPAHDDAVAQLAEVADLLAPHVDVLLFETVPSLAAAAASLQAGRTTDRPIWLSFTVDDGDGRFLRSGEALSEAMEIAAKADAVLINCSIPEVIPAGLEVLAGGDTPVGAYANGFTQITKAFIEGGTTASDLKARTDLTPAAYADHVMGWIEQGATIVGGCCEVGPDHIAEIARRIRAAGHEIV